jgi:adenylate cyclase
MLNPPRRPDGQRNIPEHDTATLDQVKSLLAQVDQTLELLEGQREMLRRRGMSLPVGTLEKLQMVQSRLDAIRKQANASSIELRTLRALADTTALITSSLDTDEVLNQVMDTVIVLTGAERGYIVLKNRETGELNEFRVARGLDKEQLATIDENGVSNPLIVSTTVVNEVAQTGEPVLTNNASEDERYHLKQSIVGYGLRSILAVPLKVRGEIIGVVYCDNRIMTGLFQRHELELLINFSHQAAVAIDNARLFEEARAQLAQVTEMRDLLNDIFASIVSGVITTDNQRCVTACNPAACAILGIEQDDDVIGLPLAEIIPYMDASFYEMLREIQTSGRATLIEAEPEVPGRGKVYWNVNASVLGEVQGRGQGIALVLDDLTEKKRQEAQLAELVRYLPPALVRNIRSIDDVNVGGQEREISALFADVRGFTSFSEQLEPETLMRVINQYLSVASDAINLYEGIVDKYMGDAVTGLFNTQINPQANHALRAVQAGYAIIYDLYALHEVLPPEQRLYYGIGIHTGVAVLGSVGSADRKEFAALGEATEISKILQENANGSVIISEVTYEYVKDAFECERVELTKTKGHDDLKYGYQVMRRKKGKTTTTSIFIDEELANLLRDE